MSKLSNIQVALGHTVHLAQRPGELTHRIIGEGQFLPSDHGLDKAEIARIREAGFLVRTGQVAVQRKSAKAGVRRLPTSPHKWNLDPRTLLDKSLDELRVMVAERDPTLEPPATVEAAIEQLCHEFDEAVDGPYNAEAFAAGAVALTFGDEYPDEAERVETAENEDEDRA